MTEPPATNHPVEAEDQEEATTPASPDVPAETLGAGIADRVAVKFLIPNVAAGSIIGKGGANISGMQAQSNARMQLSKSNEFYPGSMDGQDRILLLSGSREQLLTALHLVLMRFQGESSSPALRAVTAKDGENVVLRILVHSRLCGTLIGKGGATIRSFNENSGATFNISPPPTLPGLTERIVKITGNVDQIMRAVALVVTKLAENPDFHLLTDANLTYASRGYGAYAPPGMLGMLGGAGALQAAPGIHLAAGPGGAAYAPQPGAYGPALGQHGPYGTERRAPLVHSSGSVTLTLGIPEGRVGLVIGRHGAVVNQIKELLGVSIQISRKGELAEGGGQDRTCRVSGPREAVEIARQLIHQKIEGMPDA